MGTDIDDAFALALALVSPEIELVGVTTTSGNVRLRARLVDRLLYETGITQLPVAVGETTPGPFDPSGKPITYTQAAWAEASPLPARDWPAATPFILDAIRRHPQEITLLCIGPLTTIADVERADPETFRKLNRIVMMGGSINVGFGDLGAPPKPPPVPEYNIVQDIAAAQAVFRSGVPIEMLPLDSTQVRLDEARRERLFATGTPLTDALAQLYRQWAELNPWGDTPTLYDVVAMARIIDPGLCPTEPMRIVVDDDGYTRRVEGPVNASVCLNAQENALLRLVMTRFLRSATV